jgi:hypothetical protein
MGIASAAFAMMSSAFMFHTRSYAGLANYVDLDQKSRNALDIMSKQIRRAQWLADYGTNYLTFEDFDNTPLTFTYNPSDRTLIRTRNGTTDPKPLLTECDFFQFSVFQRNPVGGTYDVYPTAEATNCKLVQLTWICSRKIMGTKRNTESVQSAKIVIRRR